MISIVFRLDESLLPFQLFHFLFQCFHKAEVVCRFAGPWRPGNRLNHASPGPWWAKLGDPRLVDLLFTRINQSVGLSCRMCQHWSNNQRDAMKRVGKTLIFSLLCHKLSFILKQEGLRSQSSCTKLLNQCRTFDNSFQGMCFACHMICENEWPSKTVEIWWWSKGGDPTCVFLLLFSYLGV